MDFNFQTTRKVPDYSQILEILKQQMSIRNPIANAIDKGMEGFQKGYSTGTQIADRRDKKKAQQELANLLNPQIPPQVPADGPGMPVQPQGATQTGGVMPQEEGPDPMFQPPTPPINWNSVMSAMQRSGSDITPLVAQRMKPVTEENMVSLYFSPNMDKVSMVPQEGYTKTDIPSGTLAQFYSQLRSGEEKKMLQNQKDKEGKESRKLKAETVINTVNEALKKVNNWTVGMGAYLSNIRGTAATDLAGLLETIDANLGFAQLAEMKAQSRAGASGLGQLSDREMRLLVTAITNLRQSQSKGQLLSNLGKVKTHYQNWLAMEEGIDPYKKESPPAGDNSGAGGWSIERAD